MAQQMGSVDLAGSLETPIHLARLPVLLHDVPEAEFQVPAIPLQDLRAGGRGSNKRWIARISMDSDPFINEQNINWSLTTWEGARREQIRRWAALPLERAIMALEEMEALARELQEAPSTPIMPVTTKSPTT